MRFGSDLERKNKKTRIGRKVITLNFVVIEYGVFFSFERKVNFIDIAEKIFWGFFSGNNNVGVRCFRLWVRKTILRARERESNRSENRKKTKKHAVCVIHLYATRLVRLHLLYEGIERCFSSFSSQKREFPIFRMLSVLFYEYSWTQFPNSVTYIWQFFVDLFKEKKIRWCFRLEKKKKLTSKWVGSSCSQDDWVQWQYYNNLYYNNNDEQWVHLHYKCNFPLEKKENYHGRTRNGRRILPQPRSATSRKRSFF